MVARSLQRRWVVALLVATELFWGGGIACAADSPPRRSPGWAFQPLRSRDVPAVQQATWARTPVDRFILAQLESHGGSPAPEADRRTLIRRATYDLTGLPPTPEAVAAFETDPSPQAYEALIERLLASSAYGERAARRWLDVARYADNKGYVFFEERNYPWAWAYRDYVVRAFNADLPFDRFVMEQLAADQLALGTDRRALAALGFLTVGDHFSNNTHDILDDRIDVVARGLLGLTVGCARCHEHKTDPISQADYYALYGVFRSCTEPLVPPEIEPPGRRDLDDCYRYELATKEARLREYVEARHREIVRDARTRLREFLTAAHAQRGQPTTENFMLIADRGDANPTVVARWRRHIELAPAHDPVWAPWHAYAALDSATFRERAAAATQSLANDKPRLNDRVAAAFLDAPPTSMAEVIARYAALLEQVEREWQATVQGAQTSGASLPKQLSDPTAEQLRRSLYGPEAPADVPFQMDWGFLSLLPDRASQGEFQVLLKDLEQWLMSGPNAPARAMVLADLPVAWTPRVFQRGNPNRPGEPVERRFLAALGGRPLTTGSGRLDLARALVDPRNPLTARVFVNRVWRDHFGSGLVGTPGDFGNLGSTPTHPELLDWLAHDFIAHGWQVKSLHRLLMTSAVYRQANAGPTQAADPENRWLGRMPRRRHDYETQRDALLAVSGRLDPRLGGPPVGETAPRRTLYTFLNRLDLPPVMATFDFPSPATSCPQRSVTTVAPQALYWMNNAFVAECAEALQSRPEIAAAASTQERVERLFALCFGRPPSAADTERAQSFLGASPNAARWQQFTQALFLANEFVFVD